MSKILYGIWCEYDIGQEFQLFTSKDLAVSWAEAAIETILNDTYRELELEGLIGIDEYILNG